MKQLAALYADENGATLVEYVLIVGLVAVVCIAVLIVLGGRVANNYSAIATDV